MEYIPWEVLAANGPQEITAVMYPIISIMLGELTTLAYDQIKPVIGKFEIPVMEPSELSQVGARAGRFVQCVAALKEEIEKREKRKLRSDEVTEYFEKAYVYLRRLGRCPEFPWPASMSFAKMQKLKDYQREAFKAKEVES